MAKLPTFDESFDVIVIGYGFAGAVAAINAADAGARVLLAEKEPAGGGISICSYGAIRSAHSADDAFAYLKATNGGRTSDDVLLTLAEGMARVESEVRALAATSDAEIMTRENGGNYPFPGSPTFYDTNIVRVPGVDSPEALYPHLIGSGSANGWRVFKMLQDNIARREITVRCGFPARRLVADAERAVHGVCFAGPDGREVTIEAKRGVVLACGGFEADPQMKQQYWEKTPVLSAATTSNTGDGIRMAQDLGAQLWHMWHFHGSYGFKHPDPRYADAVGIRAKRLPDWVPGEEGDFKVKMSWIIVDQDGQRYMNECTPYTQDTSHRPMEFYDSQRQLFPRIPSYLVFDENGRKLYPVGAPTFNKAELAYDWSHDNLREVELGILKKADTVAGLAQALGCDPVTLEASFARWNALCAQARDADFGRPPGSMMPLDAPPYYAGAVWPVVSNTQGGPAHDTRQRVLNAFGEPIERLYVAGELGSVFGHLYLSGGNLTECFIGGQIAGREAAGLTPRK
jgi:succinate dehydrogenase/fumarate reductase flavoprotein subunit